MGIRVFVVKQTHNRCQNRKYNLLADVVDLTKTERGAWQVGKDQSAIGALIEMVPHIEVERQHGDPAWMGWVKLDPSRLTREDEVLLQKLKQKIAVKGGAIPAARLLSETWYPAYLDALKEAGIPIR